MGCCQVARRVVSEDDNGTRIHASNHNVMQKGFEGLLDLVLLGQLHLQGYVLWSVLLCRSYYSNHKILLLGPPDWFNCSIPYFPTLGSSRQ